MTRSALLLLSLLMACGGAEPGPRSPAYVVEGPALEERPVVTEVVADPDPPSCDVQMVTEPEALPDGRVRLRASLVGLGDAPVEVGLPDRCPMGPARFTGLGPAYDYYGACAMGACRGRARPGASGSSPGSR